MIFVGIDTSTTATKALVMDASGRVLGVGRSAYGFETPHPNWSEQDPELWWTATKEALAESLTVTGLDSGSIAGIGLTGQMHGLVLLDGDDLPVRRAILWNDQRTGAECDQIRELVGPEHLIAVTGNDALTGFTAPKLLWVRNHEPEVWAASEHMLLPKDFVRLRLTGRHAIDRAGGSGTILFDLAERDWSPEIIERLEIPERWLPPTHEGTAVTGAVSPDASAQTGIPAGVPVYGGGGDQAANAVGVGAIRPGVVAVSIGTSGVVFAPSDAPVVEPQGRLHAFCHAVPDRWHLMGVMLSAAGSLQWFRDTFAADSSFDDLDAAARAVPPGASGAMFMPYLTGERTPHPDPDARAAFVGLTVRHGVAEMTRAVLEGVAFGLRDGFDLITPHTAVEEIRASGGGTQSPLWLQIIADVLDTPITTVGTPESAAHGAAMLAALGHGVFDGEAELADLVPRGDTYEPSDAAATYGELHRVHRTLYPSLRETAHRLAAFDR